MCVCVQSRRHEGECLTVVSDGDGVVSCHDVRFLKGVVVVAIRYDVREGFGFGVCRGAVCLASASRNR